MEAKNSNTTVIVIAFSVVLIVAMICGMVIWLMQRSMDMNERFNDRLLDVRMREAMALTAQSESSEAATTTAAVEEMRKQLQAAEAAVKRETEARLKAENKVAGLLQNATPKKPQATPPKAKEAPPTPQPPKVQAPAVKPTPTGKLPPKRKPPVETKESAARVGSDGYPINRITLPMGNDELDWQL